MKTEHRTLNSELPMSNTDHVKALIRVAKALDEYVMRRDAQAPIPLPLFDEMDAAWREFQSSKFDVGSSTFKPDELAEWKDCATRLAKAMRAWLISELPENSPALNDPALKEFDRLNSQP